MSPASAGTAELETLTPESETTVPPTPRGEPLGPRLLLVDDNEEFRDSLAASLAEEGLTVAVAGGAREAAGMISGQRFDAAVIDLVMPGVHGLALLADLREMPEGRGLVAVVLSALPHGDTRDQARKLVGKLKFASFLDKPVTPRRVLVALGRLLAVR